MSYTDVDIESHASRVERYAKQEHIPVMVQEVIDGLQPSPGKIFLDGTIGYGGHAKAILATAGEGVQLIGLDRDREALSVTARELAVFGNQVILKNTSFQYFDRVLNELGIQALDGMLLDLGVSMPQLICPERGFSFQADGPLDMRMDSNLPMTAADIVNEWSVDDLADLIFEFGEERHSRRYARAIGKERQKQKITRTKQLADIISCAAPRRHHPRIHPATRVFQALRIAVNHELEELDQFLDKFVAYLKPEARVVILSYHSLEDRRVKNAFREAKKRGDLDILTKKPLRPSEEEIRLNPHSRSAKLRIAAKKELS